MFKDSCRFVYMFIAEEAFNDHDASLALNIASGYMRFSSIHETQILFNLLTIYFTEVNRLRYSFYQYLIKDKDNVVCFNNRLVKAVNLWSGSKKERVANSCISGVYLDIQSITSCSFVRNKNLIVLLRTAGD